MDIIKEIYPNGITHRLILPQQISFLNKASLIAELDSIPPHSQLVIDARYTHFIDKEITELLKDFRNEQAPHKHIALNLIGFKEYYDIHNYINFINVTTYNVQSNLSAPEVLTILQEGNIRFLNDTRIHRSSQVDIGLTAIEQHPIAVVLGCIDSRVPVETIFDMSFGDLFCVRVAGNIVNDDVLASIEYACHVAGAKLIVVLGHSGCGAIKAACDGVKEGHITQLLNKINPAVQIETKTMENRTSTNEAFLENVTALNIANTMLKIYKESKILHQLIEQNEIAIIGANYDLKTGVAQFYPYSEELAQLDSQDHYSLAVKMQQLLRQAELNMPAKMIR